MKRNLIFIILIMMFFCLTGCNKEKEIDKDLEEDIKVLSKLGMEGSGAESGSAGDSPADAYLGGNIRMSIMFPGIHGFYTGKIDYSKIYVLCAYIEEAKEVGRYQRFTVPHYYDDVTWVKYEKEEDIKETYKKLILTDTFIVYSITIYKDIISNEEYNQTYKFYYNIYYGDQFAIRPEIYSSNGEFLIQFEKNIDQIDHCEIRGIDYGAAIFYWVDYLDMRGLTFDDDTTYVKIKYKYVINRYDLNDYIIEEYSYEKDGEIINETQYKIKLEEIIKIVERELNEKDNK